LIASPSDGAVVKELILRLRKRPPVQLLDIDKLVVERCQMGAVVPNGSASVLEPSQLEPIEDA
jgi:hypothetical protein